MPSRGTTNQHEQRLMHVGPAHARARTHDEQRAERPPLSQEENLAWIRMLIARLGDTPELLELAEAGAGACSDCLPERDVHVRYRYGAFLVCRGCALRRIRILHLGDEPQPRQPFPAAPLSITTWAKAAGARLSQNAVAFHLDEWQITGQERDRAVKVADFARERARTAA